jgi:hypothetical protein
LFACCLPVVRFPPVSWLSSSQLSWLSQLPKNTEHQEAGPWHEFVADCCDVAALAPVATKVINAAAVAAMSMRFMACVSCLCWRCLSDRGRAGMGVTDRYAELIGAG